MTRDDPSFPSGKVPVSGGTFVHRKNKTEPRQVPVESILERDREVVLIHNGEAYRLRITANNKLILTK